MKKLFCLVLLTFIAISCTDNDDTLPKEEATPVATIDPTKLAKVIFNPGTTNEKHWSFYSNGLLKEITKPDGTVLETFKYDAKNNYLGETTSSGKSYFTYDSNNFITSIGGNLVEYNKTTNSYIVHYNSPGNPSLVDYVTTEEIFLNNELLITNERQNYDDSVTGDHYFTGVMVTYDNKNNLLRYYESYTAYKYYNTINPLKQALLPICRALSITNFNNTYLKWIKGEYTSNNNVSHNDLDEVVERYEYKYEYNSNNLPTKKTEYYFYNNVLERTNLSMLYYYQGDVIPK